MNKAVCDISGSGGTVVEKAEVVDYDIPGMTSYEYITSGYGQCPYCPSTTISGEDITVDGRFAHQEVSCNHCGKTWTDEYTLTGYEERE